MPAAVILESITARAARLLSAAQPLPDPELDFIRQRWKDDLARMNKDQTVKEKAAKFDNWFSNMGILCVRCNDNRPVAGRQMCEKCIQAVVDMTARARMRRRVKTHGELF